MFSYIGFEKLVFIFMKLLETLGSIFHTKKKRPKMRFQIIPLKLLRNLCKAWFMKFINHM